MKKKITILLILLLIAVLALLLFFVISIGEKKQPVPITEESIRGFANTSLEQYINLFVNKTDFKKFGFKSVDESRRAKLGEPLPIYNIQLDRLKRFDAEKQRLKDIMVNTQIHWFPVTVEGEVRTKLEIIVRDGKLIPGEFGKAKTARVIANVRASLPKILERSDIKSPYSVALVRISIVFAYLFYIEDRVKRVLVPAMIQPKRFGLTNGVAVPESAIAKYFSKGSKP